MYCSKCYGELSFCKECSENEQIKLLKDQLQFGKDLIHSLQAENARYREALEYIQLENKKGYIDFNDQSRYWRDQEFKSRMKAREALKGGE